MKSLISLRVREWSDFKQVEHQKCDVKASNRLYLRTWLLSVIAVSVLIPLTNSLADYPPLYDYNDTPVSDTGYVGSEITFSGAPPDTRITRVDVYFELEGWYLGATLRYEDTMDRILFPGDGEVYEGPYVKVTATNIKIFNKHTPNNTWKFGVADFPIPPSVPKVIKINYWEITVHYRDPYPPNIGVSPMSHDFGDIRVGRTSDPLEITISNTGKQALHISNIKLSDETNFTLDVNGGWNPLESTNPIIGEENNGTLTVRATGRKVMNLLPGNWGAGGLINGGSIKTKNPVGNFSVPSDAVFF